MDPERQRIQEDLRGIVTGDVRCDDVFDQLYASDGSVYQIRPLGVVRPRNAADVSAVVRYAAEKKIPIHARGAGSGLAGESLGRGLIVDFSRWMRRIVRTDEDLVRVQAGAVHAQVNAHLAPFGRVFGPDPANSSVTTMGSVIAIDGSGSYWLKFGSARRWVRSLQIVLADGTITEVGREPLTGPNGSSTNGEDVAQSNSPAPDEFRRREIVSRLTEMLTRDKGLIAKHQPESLLNCCGYQLSDVLSETHLDLGRLLCGSEGTLALVTEATLATEPLPRERSVVMLLFDRLEKAAQAVQEVIALEPWACDLLDRRHVSLARDTTPEFELLIPTDTEAVLLVEYAGDDGRAVRERVRKTVDRLCRKTQLAFDAREALDESEVRLYWQLARRVLPTLHGLKGSSRPLPIVEDVAVPPAHLPEFFVRMQNTLKRHQVTASLYGHVGHGQLHIRPFLNLGQREDVEKMQALANDLYSEVFDVGGTISGEHGDGLSRTPFVRQQYGPLYDLFREIKTLFDPLNILNPGKIVSEDPQPLTGNLRPAASAISGNGAASSTDANGAAEMVPASAPMELALQWSPTSIREEAERCNGCGTCRWQLPDTRMCPIFRVAPGEEASPRAKANLMRAVLEGQVDPTFLPSDDAKAVADLCVNCHQCRLECPSNVDIPKLMVEAKAAYVEANGLTPAEWMLVRFDRLSALGSAVVSVSNWALRNRVARWMLEKTLGIAQGRKLPRFAPRSFMRRASRRRLTRPTRRSGPKVVYFVDTFANYHDTQLADALVAIMEHNGIAVYVHPRQKSAGMAAFSMGSLPYARRLADHNIHLLAESVRQGYHIVATEPSTALCLTHEYLNLIDDNDARTVAANTSDACDYLWRLHQQGKLRLDFKPLDGVVGYHQPCHIRALGRGSPGENLLRLIPGLGVQRIERGCSGMAGLWGLKRENFRTSLRAGWGLISKLRDSSLRAGATECTSCKMQMEQGAAKPTVHPIKLLAQSYGLLPRAGDFLSAKTEDLVVT